MAPESLLVRTKRLLQEYGLPARKGLGQNFLVDGGMVKKIIDAAELTGNDTVIEIGPGLGVLTGELAKKAGKVIAIELDAGFAAKLQMQFDGNERVNIINEDILKTEPSRLASAQGFGAYKVVANLPYYITSAVIRHLLESDLPPREMVLMMQKEVAQQICARPGEMSLLSVSVQLYGNPRVVAKVPARSFYPAPKVDSTVIRIVLHPSPLLPKQDTPVFFTLVKAAFSTNRKQIVNPLSARLAMEKKEVLGLLAEAGIDHHRRAETLSIPEWTRLLAVYKDIQARKESGKGK